MWDQSKWTMDRYQWVDMEFSNKNNINITVNGKTIIKMEQGLLPMKMGTNIKDNSKIIKNMGEESTLLGIISTVKGNGKRTN